MLPAVTPAREVPPVLMEKYNRITVEQRRFQQTGKGSDVLLVAFGTAGRICESVIEPARERGLDVGLFRPITLFPFPGPELKAAAEGTKHLLVVEFNYGQMVEDVRLAVENLRPVSFLGKAAGIIPRVREILAKIEEVAASSKPGKPKRVKK
jgi:2-oxoglutarate ferredoxin oxidoreductase subunit alpha